MKPFAFRLEPLARLREVQRDERRNELLHALTVQDQLSEALERLDGARRACQSRGRETLRGGALSAAELIGLERFLASLDGQRRELEAQLSQAAAAVEGCRQLLATAEREVQALDRLRERRHEQHRLESSRRATSELDDVAARRHARRAG